MTIIEAERIKMRFGRWQGYTLAEIAGRSAKKANVKSAGQEELF